MDKKPSEKVEALAKQLQEKLRQKRPRWLRWVPLFAVVLFGALGVFAWLVLNPSPEPPPLTLTALDALIADGESASMRAYFDPKLADDKAGLLSGLEVLFVPHLAEGADNAKRKAVTKDQGQATAPLEPTPKAKTTYQVKQISKQKTNAQDSARVHVIAKDSPLLLVDAEETLADLDVKLWTKTNPQHITVRPGAAEALQAAKAKQQYAVAYIAIANAPAREYRRVRGWVENNSAGPKDLPEGPVLGRMSYEAGTDREARQALLNDLRQRFTGPLVAVVRTAEAAEQCIALGIRAIAMGGGDFPDEVTRLKGWDELPRALAR